MSSMGLKWRKSESLLGWFSIICSGRTIKPRAIGPRSSHSNDRGSIWKPFSDPFRFKSVTFDLEKGRTSRSIGIPADMFKKDYALAPPEAFNDLNSERLNDFKGIITNFALNTTSKSSIRDPRSKSDQFQLTWVILTGTFSPWSRQNSRFKK